jgi:hypothetical protein
MPVCQLANGEPAKNSDRWTFLFDDEFAATFKMSKEAFGGTAPYGEKHGGVAKWKSDKLLKKAKLF